MFAGRRKVAFVHGCFWHRHEGCKRTTNPKTRPAFWQAKFEANVTRDKRQQQSLRDLGWDVFVVWECETQDVASLEERLVALLN